MIWNELTKLALLGTERSAFSDASKKALEDLGIPIGAPDTQIILAAAGFYSQMNKAGTVLKALPQKIHSQDARGFNKICNPKSTKHLQLILDGTYEAALPEFIFYLNKNQKELSPNNLPELLDKCLESEDFFKKLKPALGKRGNWLMAQNPKWRTLKYFPNPENWDSNGLNTRLNFLKFYRENEPEKGLKILGNNWEKETFQNKIAFLNILKVGLSKTDEFFLEDALYDSRKEVRKTAAEVLTLLPNSELVGRMFIRIQYLIRFDGKNLKVFLPDELDETAIRDGIIASKNNSEGERSSILRQMFSKIPPQDWEDYFHLNSIEILDLLSQNQWKKALIGGIFKATLIHKNQTWSKSFLSFFLQKGNSNLWENLPIKKLVNLISHKNFNEIVAQHLAENKQMLSEKSPVMVLLLNSKHFWDDNVTMTVIGRFRNWLSNATSYYWDKWHYKTLLQNTAYRCSPNLFEKLKNGWNHQSPAWGMWEGDIEQFFRILVFRKEMIVELEKD